MYYPVEVEGALLSMGDCHGHQGDGETAGTGIETSLTGQFRHAPPLLASLLHAASACAVHHCNPWCSCCSPARLPPCSCCSRARMQGRFVTVQDLSGYPHLLSLERFAYMSLLKFYAWVHCILVMSLQTAAPGPCTVVEDAVQDGLPHCCKNKSKSGQIT